MLEVGPLQFGIRAVLPVRAWGMDWIMLHCMLCCASHAYRISMWYVLHDCLCAFILRMFTPNLRYWDWPAWYRLFGVNKIRMSSQRRSAWGETTANIPYETMITYLLWFTLWLRLCVKRRLLLLEQLTVWESIMVVMEEESDRIWVSNLSRHKCDQCVGSVERSMEVDLVNL